MKLKHLYFYLLPIIAGILVFTAFSNGGDNDSSKSGNEGIIKFSHSLHNDAAACEDCHSAVPKSKSLSDRLMPTMDNCSTCHDVEDEKNCTTCHYDDNYEPLIQKKSDINFNHSFHLNDEKLKCVDCHKGIGDVDYAFQSANALPAMSTCYSCHSSKGKAPNACETCHTNTVDLKPQSHKSASFILTHKFAAKAFNANCMMCHDNNSCEDCHVATTQITEKNTPDDFFQPYSPSNFGNGMKKQKITRVHDLNYRYTHGIDAKGKTSECQSCHSLETFCADCHQSRQGDFSLGGITPTSHLKNTFLTIGVGSGGGDHATLARRDIESCQSCHDVQGADPTCIKCHMDPDGIKGTNPRTHPVNFMKDNHGDWHTSEGSICYNCHTSASPSSQSGVGFCGYCHGAK